MEWEKSAPSGRVAAEDLTVSGLYRRALDYLQTQRRLRLVRPGEDHEDHFDGTPEERAQIEGEIQRAIQSHRIPVGPTTFEVKPQRGGAGLPLLVNLVALLVMAGGVYLLFLLFDNQEQILVARTSDLASAEGRLLAVLREESAEALSEKEAEIATIEERLARAEQDRQQLRAEVQARLAEREAELQAQVAQALEAERARLADADITDEERANQLAAFEAQRQAELQSELATLQAESQAELAAQEAALQQVVGEFESRLASARAEQAQLAAQLEAREAELETQFAEREANLSAERQAALELLNELQTSQEQRQGILDQILGFYLGIREALAEGAYDEAATTIESLRTYLTTGPILAVPELQRRRQVELFLVATLEEQLARARGAAEVDTRSLVESAELVAEVAELVSRAEGTLESGDIGQARELYLAALSRIPAVRIGYERLAEIEASIEANTSDQIATIIGEGNALYVQGRYDDAVARYGEALAALPLADDQLLERLLDAGYQLRSADSREELARLRDELAEQARAADAAVATARVAQGEAADLRSQLRTVEQLLATEQAAHDEAEAQLAAREAEVQALRDELVSTQELVERLGETLASVREDYALLESELESERAEVALLRERLAEQQTIVAGIDAYRRAFNTQRLASDSEALATPLELLESKLLILRIVGSESVRADYPDLYDQLNEYLDALVAEQRADAVRDTLAELSRLLDGLAAQTSVSIAQIQRLTDRFPTIANPNAADATGDFLTRLRGFARPGE